VPILLDCDPGHDDAIAILLALASPEVELLGVTTVAGNQTLEKTTANALRVLELAGRADIPVAAGAHRPAAREPGRADAVPGSPVHDALAVAAVIRPELVDVVRCGVRVETADGLCRGRTNVDRWGRMGWQPNAHVAVDVDAVSFLGLLEGRIKALR